MRARTPFATMASSVLVISTATLGSASVDPVTHALWLGGDLTKVGTVPVAHLAELPQAP